MKPIVLYTDGACKGNPGPGGWGVVLRYQETEKHLYGAEGNTTNNRMELTAAIRGLSALTQACQVQLFTDSQYVKKGITEWIHAWRKRAWRTASHTPVKNSDLWQQLDAACARHCVEWHWVKAHNGEPGNEKADQLANQAIAELLTV